MPMSLLRCVARNTINRLHSLSCFRYRAMRNTFISEDSRYALFLRSLQVCFFSLGVRLCLLRGLLLFDLILGVVFRDFLLILLLVRLVLLLNTLVLKRFLSIKSSAHLSCNLQLFPEGARYFIRTRN